MSSSVRAAALGFVFGIALVRVGGPWLGAAVAIVAVAMVWWRTVHRSTAAWLCAGAMVAASARPVTVPDLDDGRPWRVWARIIDGPRREDDGARLGLALERVERDGRAWQAQARVALTVDRAQGLTLAVGDHIAFRSKLRAPRGFINPGTANTAWLAASRGVALAAWATGSEAIVIAARDHVSEAWMWPAIAIDRLRTRMLAVLRAEAFGEGYGLLAALVAGERGLVSEQVEHEFRQLGVSHVLSVSGLHLAAIAWLVFVGLSRAVACFPPLVRVRPAERYTAPVAMVVVAAYAWLTGAEAATVRALLVSWVWFGAVLIARRSSGLDSLAIAAIGILACAPAELLAASFQLSFAAALATLMVTGLAQGWLARVLLSSLGALLATAPITAWHFCEIAPSGILWNLVFIPISELLVVPVGLLGALLGCAGLPGAGPTLAVAHAGAELTVLIARTLSPYAPLVRPASPTLAELALWSAGLITALCARRLLSPIYRRRLFVASIALLLAAVGFNFARTWRGAQGALTLTFLDVGQGDAAVVELPEGGVMVVDAGGFVDERFDPGRRIVAPYLRRLGVRRIDVLALTHPHPDHANGLAALVDEFAVGEIWTTGVETQQPGTLRLLAVAARRGVPVVSPRDHLRAGVRIRVLHPLDDAGRVTTDAALEENDNSLVLELGFAGRRVLLSGDIEAEAEARIVREDRLHAIDLLKVPHHGSRTSSTQVLLERLAPRVAVASLGHDNRWGFPHPDVVARYRAQGAELWRTDRDGAVIAMISSDGELRVAGTSDNAGVGR